MIWLRVIGTVVIIWSLVVLGQSYKQSLEKTDTYDYPVIEQNM